MASVAGWARAAALGVAAWLGTGALALVPGALTSGAGALTSGAGATVSEYARAGALLSPLTLPVFIVIAWIVLRAAKVQRLGPAWALVAAAVLPWLPGPAAPVLAAWSGPVVLLVAATVVAVALWTRRRPAVNAPTPVAPATSTAAHTPAASRMPRVSAAVAALIVAVAATATAWNLSPILPGGDEPHYLVITQSLLYDGDLAIDDNHERRDYAAYFDGTLRPDFLKRGIDGRIYSVHAPGVSAFVLPAFALAGYPGVVVWLAVFSALGSWWLWTTAWRLTGSADAAWFGWSVAALSTTAFFQSFTVFPDGPAAVLVVGVLAVIVRASPGPWWWAGAGVALGALPWLHTRYAVLAAALALGVVPAAWRAARMRGLLAFVAMPILAAAGWFWQFHAIYGTPDPRAPYGTYTQTAARYIPRGISGLLIDQQFGLLAYAPALVLALAGLAWMCVSRRAPLDDARRVAMASPGVAMASSRAVGLTLVGTIVPYAVLSAAYAMWWGGASSPARFLAPVTLALGIPAAYWWAHSRRGSSRLVGVVLAALSVATTVVLASAAQGRLAFNVRDGYALWLAWLAPAVDLAAALPSLHRHSVSVAWVMALPWACALLVVWVLARALEVRGLESRGGEPRDIESRGVPWRAVVPGAIPAIGLAAVAIAMVVGWRIEGVTGAASSQGQHRVLQRLAAPAVSAVWLDAGSGRPRWVSTDAVASRLALGPLTRGAIAADRPLVWPELPAGVYELAVPAGVERWRLGIGRDEGLLTSSRDEAGRRRVRVVLPVGVHSLRWRADAPPGTPLDAVRLAPLSLVPPGKGVAGRARTAGRYGAAAVFFLDEGAFVEPEGWWVRAERAAEVVIAPAGGRRTVALVLQNGATENEVRLESGTWHDVRHLAPGAVVELSLTLPAGAAGLPLRVTSSRGFVPAEVDPASGDRRALGVRCTVR